MMTASDVLGVLARLEAAGLTAWVDGGWGVDALIGETTRRHGDLDLVVLAPEVTAVRSVLAEGGYGTVLRDWLPTSIALADGQGREVDLHPVTPTGDGGDQALPDGGRFHYPPPTFGVIGGQRVPCVDADTQVRCHLGYPPQAKDLEDLRQLHQRLGVTLPGSTEREGR
jgi:lincosamide nucleotidyltransferase A/C/D/E